MNVKSSVCMVLEMTFYYLRPSTKNFFWNGTGRVTPVLFSAQTRSLHKWGLITVEIFITPQQDFRQVWKMENDFSHLNNVSVSISPQIWIPLLFNFQNEILKKSWYISIKLVTWTSSQLNFLKKYHERQNYPDDFHGLEPWKS